MTGVICTRVSGVATKVTLGNDLEVTQCRRASKGRRASPTSTHCERHPSNLLLSKNITSYRSRPPSRAARSSRCAGLDGNEGPTSADDDSDQEPLLASPGPELGANTVAEVILASKAHDMDAMLFHARLEDDTDVEVATGFFVSESMAKFEHAVRTDCFSRRALLFGYPEEAQVLSSLCLGQRFVQRVRVTTQSGEKAILTFTLGVEEEVIPQYGGVRVVNNWVLDACTGEPDHAGEMPRAPEHAHSPELVVLAQLEALQRFDVETVFAFASPANQEATGPVERFKRMLESPPYDILLGHRGYKVLSSAQINPTVFIQFVQLEGYSLAGGMEKPPVFQWTVRLKLEDTSDQGVWVTDSVQPRHYVDPKLL